MRPQGSSDPAMTPAGHACFAITILASFLNRSIRTSSRSISPNSAESSRTTTPERDERRLKFDDSVSPSDFSLVTRLTCAMA